MFQNLFSFLFSFLLHSPTGCRRGGSCERSRSSLWPFRTRNFSTRVKCALETEKTSTFVINFLWRFETISGVINSAPLQGATMVHADETKDEMSGLFCYSEINLSKREPKGTENFPSPVNTGLVFNPHHSATKTFSVPVMDVRYLPSAITIKSTLYGPIWNLMFASKLFPLQWHVTVWLN